MKNFLLSFALLFALTSYSQAGRFGTLKITGNSEDDTATKVLVQSSDNSVNWKAFSEFANTLQGVLNNSPNPAIGYGRTITLKNDVSSDSYIHFNLDDFFESYIRVGNGGIGSGGYFTQIGSHEITFDGDGDFLQKLTLGPCTFCDYQLPGESGIIATRSWINDNFGTPSYQEVLEAGQTATDAPAIHLSTAGGLTARTSYTGDRITISIDEDPNSILEVKPWYMGSFLDVHWPDQSGTIITREEVAANYLPIGGGPTTVNLNYIATPGNGTITTDTAGTSAVIPAVDSTNAGLMLPTQSTKLAGVATGATANDTDANLKNRANHTGTQTASTISDFTTAARGAAVLNTIAGSETDRAGSVAAVNTALAGKQNTLTSGTTIKTVGGISLLGSGNVTEVQNSLTASTVLAPSVTAVNTADAALLALINDLTPPVNITTQYTTTATLSEQVISVQSIAANKLKNQEYDLSCMITKTGTTVTSVRIYLSTTTTITAGSTLVAVYNASGTQLHIPINRRIAIQGGNTIKAFPTISAIVDGTSTTTTLSGSTNTSVQLYLLTAITLNSIGDGATQELITLK